MLHTAADSGLCGFAGGRAFAPYARADMRAADFMLGIEAQL
jgi:hypothetical protein